MVWSLVTGALALLLGTAAAEEPDISFDRGQRGVIGAERVYTDAAGCDRDAPCVITANGAFRVGPPADDHAVHLFLYRDRMLIPIVLFDSVPRDQNRLFSRAFPEHRNPGVLNIDGSLEELKPPFERTIFVFGVDNQYHLQQGDLFYLRVTGDADTRQSEHYYFRYHGSRVLFRLDVATIAALPYWLPPDQQARLSSASLGFGMSGSLGWNLDPGQDHLLITRMLATVEPTVVSGTLRYAVIDGGAITHETDAFIGGGLTGGGFMSIGVASTIAGPQRMLFPFVGLQVSQMVRIMLRIGENPSRRWARYFEREREAMEAAAGATR